MYSAVYLRPQPSAMFEGMEMAARRSWDASPNFSEGGNPLVAS